MNKPKKHIAVCGTRIVHVNIGVRRIFKNTINIYRNACAFIGKVVLEHWEEISDISNSKNRLTFVEKLIHTTKNGKAVYLDFDIIFYKFPSYYRRAAINFALGEVSSYNERMNDYNQRREAAVSKGKDFREKPPKLTLEVSNWPVLYKNESYKLDDKKLRIKVFIRNTWDWINVELCSQDYKDLMEKATQGEIQSPTLVYKYHKFYLEFPILYPSLKFPEVSLNKQVVLAVDLGVNRGATACLMDSTGTILGRFFDPFTSERDQLDHCLNRIKKVQKETGSGNSISKIYTKLDGIKNNYTCQLARWIADLAHKYKVYGVVLENLKSKGKNYNARIHHWCKSRIRDLLKGICRRYQIRVFFINPKNTSALAYDGSGKVKRGEYYINGVKYNNYSICVFPNKKQYNCNLNAAYNIGARYFIRVYQKTIMATLWSELAAKVPELLRRTDCTLSTLRKLSASM